MQDEEYYFCLNCEMIVKLDASPTKFLCERCHRPEIVLIKNREKLIAMNESDFMIEFHSIQLESIFHTVFGFNIIGIARVIEQGIFDKALKIVKKREDRKFFNITGGY